MRFNKTFGVLLIALLISLISTSQIQANPLQDISRISNGVQSVVKVAKPAIQFVKDLSNLGFDLGDLQDLFDNGTFLQAKGGGGGRSSGGRSSGGRSGWGGSSKSKSSGSSAKATSSGWGGSKKSSDSAPRASSNALNSGKTSTAADRAAYQKAASAGKVFSSTSAAKADFKAKAKTDPNIQAQLSKSYPTKYSSEPATRPAHIPQTYNGQTVIYQNGGYGYQGPSGFTLLTSYMLLDTMTDAMMMSSMRSNGYYVGSAPPPPYVSTGPSPFAIVLSILFIMIFIGVIAAIFNA